LAGLLQYIKTPHIIVDAHWEPEQGIAGFVQRLILKMGSRVIHQVQVHSPEECDIYEKEFGIDKQKIVDIPFSTSLIGYDLEERSGDFILTGGRSFRDYPTFCKAIENLPYKVEIGLPSDYPLDEFNKIQTKSNVTIHTTLSNREFMDKMASCKVLALPITPKLKRSTADQTILNAMYFGKIVIATNSIGSRIYIEDGVNGFLVDEEDSESWKDALQRIYNLDSHIIDNIKNQAKSDARNKFSEDIRLYKTLDSALNAI
jgi:glycosyltransferase involved in cell wall biosynthesis